MFFRRKFSLKISYCILLLSFIFLSLKSPHIPSEALGICDFLCWCCMDAPTTYTTLSTNIIQPNSHLTEPIVSYIDDSDPFLFSQLMNASFNGINSGLTLSSEIFFDLASNSNTNPTLDSAFIVSQENFHLIVNSFDYGVISCSSYENFITTFNLLEDSSYFIGFKSPTPTSAGEAHLFLSNEAYQEWLRSRKSNILNPEEINFARNLNNQLRSINNARLRRVPRVLNLIALVNEE